MAVTVRIPTPLRKLTGGEAQVHAEGRTVREVLAHVEAKHPGIQAKILDESGEVRRFIFVSVNGQDIRQGSGPETAVKPGDEVSIVPAIAGGSSPSRRNSVPAGSPA